MSTSPQSAESQPCFALENLAQPPKTARPKNYNFAKAVKKTLRALRRFEEVPGVVRAIANVLLELSLASERTFAYIRRQGDIGRLIKNEQGNPYDKTAISRGLDWMEEKKIIIRAGSYYAFHSGIYVRISQAERSELALEFSFDYPDCQPFFPREVNLNDQQLDAEFGQVESVSTSAPGVAPGSTAVESTATEVSPPSTPVDPSSTRKRTQYHEEVHDPNSMSHDRRANLEREYDVDTAGAMTGHEIIQAVKQAAKGKLRQKSIDAWVRRLGENPKLVWQAAAEAKQRYDLQSPAGWMNRFYLTEMGIDPHSRRQRE